MTHRNSVPLAARSVSTAPGGHLVIVGTGEWAAVALERFCRDSPYEVVAVSAEAGHLGADVCRGLPLVPLADLAVTYPPGRYVAFVAAPSRPSQARRRLYDIVKSAGYTCASYIGRRVFAVRNVQIGENTFVHERAALQHMARIGDNVIVESGTCIGHSAVVADDCFVGQRVAISGFCRIGRGCFLGAGCFVDAAVSVADGCVLRPGTVVLKDTKPDLVYSGNPAHPGAAAFSAWSEMTWGNG
jgi:sugar O-acyltransferase (sialic acid O-acetyltransferase NeuD family)